MKSIRLVTFVTIGLIACVAATGCKKKPQKLTVLPGQGVTVGPGDTGVAPAGGNKVLDSSPPMVTSNPLVIENPGIGTTNKGLSADGNAVSPRDFSGRPQDRTKWQSQTVHFDFDRYVVKTSEAPKVDVVASEFKTCDPNSDLLIEGHCDERGTPGYNLSLGEKRAMAIREYLIRAGVNPERVHTISFGKEKPVALGHDEASWSKNRRGEFIFVLPK